MKPIRQTIIISTSSAMVYCLLVLFCSGTSLTLLAQDYQYDANGNLTHDQNKDIASLHYNFLNLADTITFIDGRKIIYTYTASGQKIKQQVIQPNGSVLQKREYSGNIIYKNGILDQVQTHEGRIVPLLAGSSSFAAPVYQYHLKDHLGNVRLTCTSRRDTLVYSATMENGSLEQENQLFKNLNNRVSYKVANHTPQGSKVLSVKAGEKSAAILSLSVRKGDVIIPEVYSYYEKGTKGNSKKISDVFIPTLLAPITGGVSAGEIISSGVNSNIQGLGALSLAVADDVPQAYLNYQLFDKNYQTVDGGFQRVTQAGNFALEKLSLAPIVIKESGYLNIYLSNTSSDGQVVYFDDVNVTYIPVPIIQEDSYYPFGMPMEGRHDQREGEVANRNLFNSKELQDDFGLNWYDYGARMYDAPLGRWLMPDAKEEKYASWSPYQYVMNNPLKFIDPDGKDIIYFINNLKTEDQRNKSELAKQYLESTDEGRTIMESAKNNNNVTVYVSFVDHLEGSSPGEVTVGYTIAGRQFAKFQNGKFRLDIPGDGDDFSIFSGIDITTAVQNNKKVYLILIVANGDPYAVAESLGHEVNAHVNMADKITMYLMRKLNPQTPLDGDLQHLLYGSKSSAQYPEVTKDGKKKIVTETTANRKASSAYRLQIQLGKLKEENLNKNKNE